MKVTGNCDGKVDGKVRMMDENKKVFWWKVDRYAQEKKKSTDIDLWWIVELMIWMALINLLGS